MSMVMGPSSMMSQPTPTYIVGRELVERHPDLSPLPGKTPGWVRQCQAQDSPPTTSATTTRGGRDDQRTCDCQERSRRQVAHQLDNCGVGVHGATSGEIADHDELRPNRPSRCGCQAILAPRWSSSERQRASSRPTQGGIPLNHGRKGHLASTSRRRSWRSSTDPADVSENVGARESNRPMANTADTTDRGHPIRSAAAQIDDILKTVRDAPAWSMSPAETREAMVEATRLDAQLAELEARVAHHGQTVEVEADSGATSTANWWAHATKQTRAAAHRKTRLAAALGSEAFEPTRVALAEGRLLVDQAQVIVAAVEALPADLDRQIAADAQASPGRVRRPPRRPGAADPGEPDPGGRRPGGRRGPRSPAARDARSGRRRPLHRSGSSRTGTASATAGSPSPPCTGRCSGSSCSRSRHRNTAPRWTGRPRTRTPVRAPAGGGVRGVHRDLPHRPAPACRWRLGHGRGHHDRGHPDGRVEGRPDGHRPPDQPRPGPEARLPGRDHPRRPRHPVPGPRPRSEDPVPHRTPTDRPGPGTGRLHRGGL